MTIDSWLTQAIRKLLETGIPSARLDAELILAHTLRKSRTWLHAHGDEPIDTRRLDIAYARLELRCDRVPIAYIIGHKEFYGRRFDVTPSVLIPRPESEAFFTLLSRVDLTKDMQLVDVGTGSGCLGITAKLEYPELAVSLVDIDSHALRVAEKNAANLGAIVTCIKSDLLADYPYTADIVLANLPYVDQAWDNSPELQHEPALALYAEDNGTSLIRRLIDQCDSKLQKGGHILIEADMRQHHLITHYAESHHLTLLGTEGLILLYQSPAP